MGNTEGDSKTGKGGGGGRWCGTDLLGKENAATCATRGSRTGIFGLCSL